MIWIDWFDAKVTACADAAWREYMRTGGMVDMYLWYSRGELIVSAGTPPGTTPVTGERVPSHLEYSRLRRWISDRARRVPCLPDRESP